MNIAQIKKIQDKHRQIKKRAGPDLTKDFDFFIDEIENGGNEKVKKINMKQKLDEEQIIQILDYLKFKRIKKNVYINDGIELTVKPGTTLYQLIRLYGHNKYLKGRGHIDIEIKKSWFF